MDYTVHGILQAWILEWAAFSFSRVSFRPRESNPGLLHSSKRIILKNIVTLKKTDVFLISSSILLLITFPQLSYQLCLFELGPKWKTYTLQVLDVRLPTKSSIFSCCSQRFFCFVLFYDVYHMFCGLLQSSDFAHCLFWNVSLSYVFPIDWWNREASPVSESKSKVVLCNLHRRHRIPRCLWHFLWCQPSSVITDGFPRSINSARIGKWWYSLFMY